MTTQPNILMIVTDQEYAHQPMPAEFALQARDRIRARGQRMIIVASIGAASGVIGPRLFAVIVGMAIVSTLIVPPVLRVLFRRRGDVDDPVPA